MACSREALRRRGLIEFISSSVARLGFDTASCKPKAPRATSSVGTGHPPAQPASAQRSRRMPHAALSPLAAAGLRLAGPRHLLSSSDPSTPLAFDPNRRLLERLSVDNGAVKGCSVRIRGRMAGRWHRHPETRHRCGSRLIAAASPPPPLPTCIGLKITDSAFSHTRPPRTPVVSMEDRRGLQIRARSH